MSPDELSELHQIQNRLAFSVQITNSLASKVDGVVHDSVTERLTKLTQMLDELHSDLVKLGNALVSTQMREAEESSQNVLNAMLAGATVANRGTSGP